MAFGMNVVKYENNSHILIINTPLLPVRIGDRVPANNSKYNAKADHNCMRDGTLLLHLFFAALKM